MCLSTGGCKSFSLDNQTCFSGVLRIRLKLRRKKVLPTSVCYQVSSCAAVARLYVPTTLWQPHVASENITLNDRRRTRLSRMVDDRPDNHKTYPSLALTPISLTIIRKIYADSLQVPFGPTSKSWPSRVYTTYLNYTRLDRVGNTISADLTETPCTKPNTQRVTDD